MRKEVEITYNKKSEDCSSKTGPGENKSIKEDEEEISWKPSKTLGSLDKNNVGKVALVKKERFNREVLLLLLDYTRVPRHGENPEKLHELHMKLRHYADASDFDSGCCEVEYSFSGKAKTFGRLYGFTTSKFRKGVRKNICLQSFPRWVRAALGSPFYYDVDIVNCHPTLLLGWKSLLMMNDSFEVVSLPLYCKYRDEILDFLVQLFKIEPIQGQHDNTRKFAKRLLAVLMYGGSLKSWRLSLQGEATCELSDNVERTHPTKPEIAKFSLEGFRTEVIKIGQYLIDFTLLSTDSENPEDRDLANYMLTLLKTTRAQDNPNEHKEVFKFMSLLLQETERMVISEIENSLYNIEENQPVPLDVLIHDGGLVRRRVNTSIDFRGNQRFLNYPFDKYLDQNNLDKLQFEALSSSPLHQKLLKNPLAFTQEASNIFSVEIHITCKPLDISIYQMKMEKQFCVARPILRTYAENKYFLEEERHLAYITKGNAYIYNGEYISDECLRKQLTDLYFIASNVTNQLSDEAGQKQTASAGTTALKSFSIENRSFSLDLDASYETEPSISTEQSGFSETQSGSFMLPRAGRLPFSSNKKVKKQNDTPKHIAFFPIYCKDPLRRKYSQVKFIEDASSVSQLLDPFSICKKKGSCESVKYLLTKKESYPLLGLMHEKATLRSVEGINSLQQLLLTYALTQKQKLNPTADLPTFVSNYSSPEKSPKKKFLRLSEQPLFDVDTGLFDDLSFKQIRDASFPHLRLVSPEQAYPLLNHLFILVGRDQEIFEYVVRYFAFIACYPEKKFGGCGLIFTGEEEGSGKSKAVKMFLELFAPFAKETNDADQAFGRFSSMLEHCLIVHFEDITSRELGTNQGVFKNRLTSDTVKIERKNIQQYQTENFCRFIITSNYDNPLHLGSFDRRWAIIKCSAELCGDVDYFLELECYRNEVFNRQAALLTLLSVQVDGSWNPETARPPATCEHLQPTVNNPLMAWNQRKKQSTDHSLILRSLLCSLSVFLLSLKKDETSQKIIALLKYRHYDSQLKLVWIQSSKLLDVYNLWFKFKGQDESSKKLNITSWGLLFHSIGPPNDPAKYRTQKLDRAGLRYIPVELEYWSKIVGSDITNIANVDFPFWVQHFNYLFH